MRNNRLAPAGAPATPRGGAPGGAAPVPGLSPGAFAQEVARELGMDLAAIMDGAARQRVAALEAATHSRRRAGAR